MEEGRILENADIVLDSYEFHLCGNPEFTEGKINALDKGPYESYHKADDGGAHKEEKPILDRLLDQLGAESAFHPTWFFCFCHLFISKKERKLKS